MQNTLAQELWPLARSSRMAQVLLVIAGTVLLAASAKVQVPFWPVPMTMQTFVVLLLGIAYGPRLGFITGALYLVEGALGLPVFAKGAGMAYLMGPTGGYLFGFVVAMGICGLLAKRGWSQTVLGMLGVMLVGQILILAPGVLWLGAVIGMDKAITLGLTPFIAAEVFKVALAAATVPLVWRAVRH